mmetsp:Transcript_10735/g.11795  ORF Transcript_10735/g.11795 Transcript_10735/m.11795 type:complete len:438 (-) Transcript_10735:5-1318(-)
MGFAPKTGTIVLVARCLILSVLIIAVYFVYSIIRVLFGSKSWKNRYLAPILLTVGIGVLLFVFPVIVDYGLNRVDTSQQQYLPNEISKEIRALHKSLFIADMHSDTLLWGSRDILVRNKVGHVDLPRLIDGNVALQMFTIVTSSPSGQNFDKNKAPTLISDTITMKAVAERWGWDAITSKAARTMSQINRFYGFVKNSNNHLYIASSKQELVDYIKIRKSNGGNISAGILGIEGAHALDGKLENVKIFYDAGVRMMGLTHFFDNKLGGSAHGVKKGGLTDFGRKVVKKMEELGMIIDLAHASPAIIDDVLEFATKPLLSSHTGVSGLCPSIRNLKDDHVRGIAKTGGIISVAFFSPVICQKNMLAGIVATIKYIRDLVGVEYIALGSDFDGTVIVPFDTTGLIYITNALKEEGFTDKEVAKVMGGNMRDFWLKTLPE